MDLNKINKVFFVGIGGIGMSALARYFKFHGREVRGYDKTPTVLTGQLEAEGIPVHFNDEPENVMKDADLVVYTPAIPAENKELQFYRENNYLLLKRSEVLGLITESSFNICVAGTHGKTTVSTMIAHILRHTGYGCNAFLGGIAVNYNSNYWSDKRNLCVIEADEYDRSFLKLSPDFAIITAMDADHLDIYGTEAEVQNSFIEFSGRVKNTGTLFYKLGLNRSDELRAKMKKTYHLDDSTAEIYATNIRMENGSYFFDFVMDNEILNGFLLNMGGAHNVENAIVSIAVAKSLGLENEKIKNAVAAFKGVKRRFEYIVKSEGQVYIDDYAHHPEELRVLIHGAKALFKGKKTTIIFQPHLFTRTRDFADGFAEVLSGADEVILLPIYPAREKPIPGVESNMILQKMKNKNARILDKAGVLNWIAKNKSEVLITAGAGDIDQLIEPIKKILS
ncbi:MAG: UDP-N-acetylmuramate--L-alanine ligase [Bacteroidetes bacterium]|nr:MAG: UDP-N-acetylmuramate--L-alanine ligase [Bacteroidota bacterium]